MLQLSSSVGTYSITCISSDAAVTITRVVPTPGAIPVLHQNPTGRLRESAAHPAADSDGTPAEFEAKERSDSVRFLCTSFDLCLTKIQVKITHRPECDI
jgi:hypothetical protein